ncbi:MAG: ketoacyl-ACP synthase III [Candidatus Dadabacteria bacterium]|nr:MAG: ketoacyl-ACP synthase III [Candidatus Dadabacteria bacterium]
MTTCARIVSTGMAVPDRIVTNEDLRQWMDTSDEWIRQRTGIEQRHWVRPDEPEGASDLGLRAATAALDEAGWDAQDIDLILFATLSPDIEFPGSGCLLQHKLGLETTPAMDIRNQCSGFLYGLATADAWIRAGMARRILLVGAEVHSTGLDISTRGRAVTVIFGDGAGAACIEASPEPGILATRLHAQGEFAGCLMTEAPASRHWPRIDAQMIAEGRHFPHMEGPTVFKHAVRRLPEVAAEVLEAANVSLDDIDIVVPHQANLRINQFVARALKLDESRVVNNIQRYGNTTAASIPIALHEARQDGRIAPGSTVLFLGFGAGFTWGGAVCRF